MPHYCMELNNLLQGEYRGQTQTQTILTWETKQDGHRHEGDWVAIAYIRGIEYGRGSASTIRAAKEKAARQALEALTE